MENPEHEKTNPEPENQNPTGPTFGGTLDIAENPTSGPLVASEKPGEVVKAGKPGAPDQKFFQKLLGNLGGTSGNCTCGKPAGQRGRHKDSCGIYGGGKGNFAAPLVQHGNKAAAVGGAADSDLVPVERPASPADFAFYGRCGRTWAKFRSEFKRRSILKKCAPVVGDSKAESLAAEFQFRPADVDELEKAIAEVAQTDEWPKVPGVAKIAWILAEFEISAKVSEWRMSVKRCLEPSPFLGPGSV